MAQKNRTKEVWLIPKRVNLHQTICLIDGIIDRNYDGTSWNPQKQNNLGVNLKKWGATKDGKNVAPQSIRTLVASIPQYLGFIYVNTHSTPNTICLTKAGVKLWRSHKDELVKISNLVEGKEYLITQSNCVLEQMEKLQITNPVINKDCENILVFPFRFTLKVLMHVGYLDQEEIAYFLFRSKNEDEIELVVKEIENFRKLSVEDRESIINAFKATHIGNITLVKASSAGYFMSLCKITGIIDKLRVTPINKNNALSAIKINEEYMSYVEEMLNNKYKLAEAFDFKDNLSLWIEYIGDPYKHYPPIEITIDNKTSSSYLVQVYRGDVCKYDDLIAENGRLQIPLFIEEEYEVKIIDCSNGDLLEIITICPSFENRCYEIEGDLNKNKHIKDTLESLNVDILEHCEATNFSGRIHNYLNTLSKMTGVDKTRDKALRGAYLEYLVFKMLNILRDRNIIDDVIWNGKVGKYGLPTQAPGGKTGTPDIVFIIDDQHFVLELTTIKSKALQFSAEGSSVPDHIRLYKQETRNNVEGIFCAPKMHDRNTVVMQTSLATHKINLHCVTVEELLNILKIADRELIKKRIINS